MRVDCSRVLEYKKERYRMCKSYTKCTDGCKLFEHLGADCNAVKHIDIKAVRIVQKWSDEHQQETMVEHFYKIHPKARKQTDGLPMICVMSLGWIDKCPKNNNLDISCAYCWNSPYTESSTDNVK